MSEGREDKAHKLNLGHWLHALRGHTDRQAGDHCLGQRRVEDPLVAVFILQAVGGPEDAAVFAHILAQDHNLLVASHLMVEGQGYRFDKRQSGHSYSPPRRMTSSRWARKRSGNSA